MHRIRFSSAQSSAAIIGCNGDLLTEIFLFLPTKSLIRFKLVCKQWRSLISAPSFSRLHTLHHRRRRPELQHSFILRGKESRFFICHPSIRRLVPFRFPFPHVKILQSCNGLLLLECRNSPHGHNDYYVFNPTTMKLRNLFLSKVYSGICLIFDPSKSPHYRVVCFRSFTKSTSFHVYDSETHSWRNGGDCDKGSYKFCDGVYWNGCVYFMGHHETSFCFAPEAKIYSVPNPPRIWWSGAKKDYIVESNGHLHCLSLYLKPDINYVLEMNVENEWYINSRADSNPISATFVGNGNFNLTEMDLLGMTRGERAEDSILLFHVPGMIMVYRFFDEACEVLVDFTGEDYFDKDRLQFGFKDAHPFVESFAPV